ncbi:MAG TPA: asparagine synthase (glutamine-hydrolyzing), partial [Pusillimonas sp.]|nr:asparagine synthase (glutamine-hydrolyzing) [Pusillimonas sp.]
VVGMFALALWDRSERALCLARDRMGEKPLYYGFSDSTLFFASELKALHAIPGVDWTISRDAVALMMRHNYIPAPHSIHRNVRKLMPGTYVRYTPDTLRDQFDQQPLTYWSACEVALESVKQPLAFNRDEDALDALDTVLATSIRGQMMADVPLGAFLSGGIDSSLVVAMMQSQCADPVNTFSIGFNEPRFNEAEHARAVAEHLGTRHTELYVSAHDAMSVLPALSEIYDEPFADASQIPTTLLMRLARQHVTVSLSGDGGDELFGGYSRYQRAMSWWSRRSTLPNSLSQAAGRVSGGAARWLPGARRSQRLAKLGQILTASGAGPFYQQFVSYQGDPASFVLGASLPPTPFDKVTDLAFFDHITWLDAVTYLPDDILVKVDRAAMAASLETRVPMLDHRVYTFARRLPYQYKVRDGQGKWLLRQLLHRYVPPALVDRSKKGFSVPLGEWLREP